MGAPASSKTLATSSEQKKERSIRNLGPGVVRHSSGSDGAESQADPAPEGRQQTAPSQARTRPRCADIVRNFLGGELGCMRNDSKSLLLCEVATTERNRENSVFQRVCELLHHNPPFYGLDDARASNVNHGMTHRRPYARANHSRSGSIRRADDDIGGA
jgi:hypothetical protein